MTEKSNMAELFNDFEQLPELEDTVELDNVVAPEDDFFEGDVEPEYPTYGQVKDLEWPTYTFKTSGGKTVEVYHEKYGTLWSVKFREGGQLPESLTGKYTTATDACQAVEVYLASNS